MRVIPLLLLVVLVVGGCEKSIGLRNRNNNNVVSPLMTDSDLQEFSSFLVTHYKTKDELQNELVKNGFSVEPYSDGLRAVKTVKATTLTKMSYQIILIPSSEGGFRLGKVSRAGIGL